MDVLSIAANLYYYIYELFRSPDYHVTQAYIYYRCDSVTDTELVEPWVKESKYWSSVEDGGYYMDITSQFRASKARYLQELLDSKPSNVTDMLYVISYTWGNKKYKYASRSPSVQWPPVPHPVGELKFRLPIHSAWACTEDGRETMNITNRIKKFSGPHSDFHKEGVMFSDIMKYDFPKIKINTLLCDTMYSENDSILLI
tara:strand:+ start:1168 stop:1767 length:600 start_codon:yes stop_codon:yes gene_type:complete